MSGERDALDWSRDGQDWPNAACSRIVEAGGLSWHVQMAGDGPALLLVHGTAASTHSWREVMPLLAQRYQVIAMDLPGHAFSGRPVGRALTLPAMAQLLAALLVALKVEPVIAVGHSAGAAILVQASLDRLMQPERIIGLNAALLPFEGIGRHLFPTLARLMALNPLLPAFFAWRAAGGTAVEELITGTGSQIDPAGLALYRRLLARRGHVATALDMMANWDLRQLERRLPFLSTPTTLIACSNDRAVPPDQAWQVRDRNSLVEVRLLRDLGHLAHEEAPGRLAALIEEIAGAPPRTPARPT